MLKILLDRTEPSVESVQQRQNFNEVLAALSYQKQIMNPWRYWYYPAFLLVVLLLC